MTFATYGHVDEMERIIHETILPERNARAVNRKTGRTLPSVFQILTMIDDQLNALLFGDDCIASCKSDSSLAPCIAWHTWKNIVAISSRNMIHLYDVGRRSWLNPLHMDEHPIYCMTWLSESDSLLVGTTGGVINWKFYKLAKGNTDESSMQFFDHPRRSQVSSVSASPNGRLFAAVSSEDTAIYIWDVALGIQSPLYCLGGERGHCVNWSPSGLHIAASDRERGMHIIDTYRWQYDYCGLVVADVQDQHIKTCWLSSMHCIFYLVGTKSIYSCSQTDSTSKAVGNVTGNVGNAGRADTTINTSTECLELDCKEIERSMGCECCIQSIISEVKDNDSFMAVSFTKKDDLEDPIGCVGIYIVSKSLSLKSKYLCNIKSPSRASMGNLANLSLLPSSMSFLLSSRAADESFEAFFMKDRMFISDQSLSLRRSTVNDGQSSVIAIVWSNNAQVELTIDILRL